MDEVIVVNNRNYTLDILKAFAAFFVVFIHSPFPGIFGEVVSSVAQSGVLLFYMISGYYICNASTKKIVKSIKHILFLIAVTYILNIIRILISTNFNPYETIVGLISVKHILNFLILNISSVSGVMWFMLALLYCYIIYLILNKLNLIKILYVLMPLLLIGNLLAGDILVKIGITNFSGYVRNFVFTGIPFFTLGNYIHFKQGKIKKAEKVSFNKKYNNYIYIYIYCPLSSV